MKNLFWPLKKKRKQIKKDKKPNKKKNKKIKKQKSIGKNIHYWKKMHQMI